MNELQKEYFERAQKEREEAEAAEEARLLKVLEAEREKDAKKQAAAKKAAEEAERKAEAEAEEIINQIKAKIDADKMKAATEKQMAEEEKQKAEKRAENVKRFEEDQKAKKQETGQKAEKSKAEPEKPEAETEKPKSETEKPKAEVEETKPKEEKEEAEKPEEETNIYEREPMGEASMPKKSPKFKKGGKKSSNTGKVPQRPQPQEAVATEEPKPTKEGEATVAEQVEETEEATVKVTQPEEGEPFEKATPESKAAADREAKLQEQADEWQDKYKRLLAEFENARAREAKEASRMYDIGAKAVLEKLLPVVDNFERAIQTIPEEDKERAFEQGVDKIYKQMMTTLEEIGVQPMNAEGTEFNPDLHNAVMHVEDENFGENVVAEEMQKGYMYKDSVLRYSMVKVAN